MDGEASLQHVLCVLQRDLLGFGVGFDLIHPDRARRGVGGGGVLDEQSADRAGRDHRGGAAESHADFLGDVHEVEDGPLLGVVGQLRVADGGADARDAVRGDGEVPPRGDVGVDVARERLGEAMRQRLRNDAALVVARRLEALDDLLGAKAARADERADVVLRALGGDKVGDAGVDFRRLELLPDRVEGREDARPRVVGVELDGLVDGVCGVDAHDAARLDGGVAVPLLRELLAHVDQPLGFGAAHGVVQDVRVVLVGERAPQLEDREELVPADQREEVLEPHVVRQDLAVPELVGRRGELGARGVEDEPRPPSLVEGHELLVLDFGVVRLAELLLGRAQLGDEVLARVLVREVAQDADDLGSLPRGGDGTAVARRERERRVQRAGRRAADEDGDGQVRLLLHHFDELRHLVEGRGDQTGHADGNRLVLDARRDDLLGRGVDPQVDDLVAVARQHDADDVLADVVHVALHGGEHEDRLVVARAAGLLLLEQNRLEVVDRLLHHARRAEDLREEHLALRERLAHLLEARGERPLDDLHRRHRLRGLGDVRAELRRVARDQCKAEALLEVEPLPRVRRLRARRRLRPAEPLGDLDELLGGGAGVHHRTLHDPARLLGDGRVGGHGGRVEDRHVEADARGVVEEDGVHDLADGVVAAEREREVGDAAGEVDQRVLRLDLRDRVDEVPCVRVVLLHAGGDGEHVQVEDDVLGQEADLADEEVVAPQRDLDLLLRRRRLPVLVERHDDDRRAVLLADLRALDEVRLALLQADRVDEALALHELQTGLDDAHRRRVDAERDARDVGLGAEVAQELPHGLRTVRDVAVVERNVEALCHADLLARKVHGGLPALLLDGVEEHPAPGDVALLADAHNVGDRVVAQSTRLQAGDVEGVEPREVQRGHVQAKRARREPLGRLLDGGDVCRVGAAAAADDVDELLVLHDAEHLLGELLAGEGVASDLVGQPGVRVGGEEHVREALVHPLEVPLEHFDVRDAVEPHDQRACVRDARTERLDRLSGERAPGGAHDGHGDPERHGAAELLEDRLGRGDGRLAVQRVEDGLDDEQVDAAFEQPLDLLEVGAVQGVKVDLALLRAVRVHGGGRGLRGRADRAGDERALLFADAVLCRVLLRRGYGDLSRSDVEPLHVVNEVVLLLGDGVGAERVCLDDVCPSFEVAHVEFLHDLRTGEAKDLVVALQLHRVILELCSAEILFGESVRLEDCAGGAIEDGDPVAEDLFQVINTAHR